MIPCDEPTHCGHYMARNCSTGEFVCRQCGLIKQKEIKMGKRGEVTDEIIGAWLKHTDSGITTQQLRLLPYVQYCVMNDCNLSPDKINQPERVIISDWKNDGNILPSYNGLKVSKRFWDAMCDVLWLAYASHE